MSRKACSDDENRFRFHGQHIESFSRILYSLGTLDWAMVPPVNSRLKIQRRIGLASNLMGEFYTRVRKNEQRSAWIFFMPEGQNLPDPVR